LDHLNALISQHLHALGFPGEAIVQLMLAAVCGGLVGLEREMRGRQAGFRTNLLVCVGSALVMIASQRIAYHDWPRQPGVNIQVDPARIAYGVMTGIGFLGAGTILREGNNIHGLTTAAGLWCVAALGLAAGQGLYVLLAFATVLILLALWLLEYVQKLLPRTHYRQVTLRRHWENGCVADTIRQLKAAGLYIVDAAYERTPDLNQVDIRLRIGFRDRAAFYAFEQHLTDDRVHELLAVSE
jgi:putative Mg2+ transporter-C (MgtC) family protein